MSDTIRQFLVVTPVWVLPRPHARGLEVVAQLSAKVKDRGLVIHDHGGMLVPKDRPELNDWVEPVHPRLGAWLDEAALGDFLDFGNVLIVRVK